MTEIYNKRYIPVGEATYGHVILREFTVPSSALVLDTPYTSNDLAVNFQGFSRQAFKVLPLHVGAGSPTMDVDIEEFIPSPSDPTQGNWAVKSGLGGPANVAANVLFEHNSEDIMRFARLVITPRSSVVDSDVQIELSGVRKI